MRLLKISKVSIFLVGIMMMVTLLYCSSQVQAALTASVSFTGASTYNAGTFPESVAVGDFNGDGKPDLAVTNPASNSVSILLGNGDGTFQVGTSFPVVGISPESVAVGDFNGDRKSDLAVTNPASNSVSILLGNGDGTFQVGTSFPVVGISPESVAVGDFNGDGKSDLAVTNPASNSVSILLGNGDGTFQVGTSFPVVGISPESVAVGDFNGDGKSDLAVTNSASNSVSVLITLDHTPPSISSVSIPNVTMKVGSTTTTTITVANDGGDVYGLGSSTIGSFALSNLTKINSTTYTAQFTVTEGGVDVPAGSNIPVNIVLTDSTGNCNTVYTAAISQAGDAINAHTPTDVTLSNASVLTTAGMNAPVGVLSSTDGSSGDTFTYTLVSGTDSTDNAFFSISGNSLKANNAGALTLGTKSVRVRSTDADGNFYEKVFSITVSELGPIVTSVNLASASTVVGSATSVDYIVTFNESVTGVDSSDFTLTRMGTANGTIASVSGSGTTFTVTVNSLSGDGTLRLDLISSGTGIVNGSSTAISGGFTSGQTYTLDHTPPSISSVSIPNVTMKVGSTTTTTITVANDGGDVYGLGSSTIGSFALSNLTKINSTTYTAQFTVTEGGVDVPAGSNIPVNIVLTDSTGNCNTVYTAAISQAGDAINAHTPTDVTLSNASVLTTAGMNAPVGVLSSTDGSSGDTFTYTLVSGTDSTDNAFFSISGNSLKANNAGALTLGTKSVRVRSTDADGNFYEKVFSITVSSPTYTVTYNGNVNTGGVVPSDSNPYMQGDTVTVLGNIGSLTKTGYTFAGWNTAANGSGTSYGAGAMFAMGSSQVTLYAQWTTIPSGGGWSWNPGQLQFSQPTYTVDENGGTVTIIVDRLYGSDGTITVHYSTSDNTAKAGEDYTATSSDLTFGYGETSKTFTIPITNDAILENNEIVNLTLTNPTGGTYLGSQTTATLTIQDTTLPDEKQYLLFPVTGIDRGVPSDKTWQIVFNQGTDPKTVDMSSIFICNATTGERQSVTYKFSNDATTQATTLTIKPSQPYISGKSYILYITTGVKDVNNSTLKQGLRVPFNVR